MENNIEIWYLVLSLILPRVALLIAYCGGTIPYNNIPFIGDVFMAIFVPRILNLIYITVNLGTGSPWFWVHLIVMICAYLGSINVSNQSRSKKYQ